MKKTYDVHLVYVSVSTEIIHKYSNPVVSEFTIYNNISSVMMSSSPSRSKVVQVCVHHYTHLYSKTVMSNIYLSVLSCELGSARIRCRLGKDIKAIIHFQNIFKYITVISLLSVLICLYLNFLLVK